jgi:hypothetical protein
VLGSSSDAGQVTAATSPSLDAACVSMFSSP